jgi:hypothetical protein
MSVLSWVQPSSGARLPRAVLLFAAFASMWLATGFMALAQQSQTDAAAMKQERLVIHTAQGNFPFTVEVADEPQTRARGLMFRQTMAADHGMLFVFGQTRPVSMWMKNTPLSLDMVFLRPDGTVSSVAQRTTPFSEAIIDSGGPVSYVLELRAGVARMIGLKPGDKLESPSIRP